MFSCLWPPYGIKPPSSYACRSWKIECWFGADAITCDSRLSQMDVYIWENHLAIGIFQQTVFDLLENCSFTGWWFWNMTFIFPYIGNVIIPID